MSKEMIISSNGHETRVAILEDDQVAEIFIERERQRGVVGNLYKGRVSKVLPGMQSAFVDLGLERDGFLYVSDVADTFEELDRLESDDEEHAGPSNGSAPQALPSPGVNGRQPTGGGRGPRGGRDREGSSRGSSRGEKNGPPEPKIEELLKEGQEIIVQVAKEPLGTKGARLTSHATMPGRFLVFMPTVDHVGVSRKIESRDERSRLRGIVREFREQTGFAGGVIIRTAAASRPKEDIVSDLSYFHKVWTEIRQKAETSRAPAVVYREQSLVAKLLRDLGGIIVLDFIDMEDRKNRLKVLQAVELELKKDRSPSKALQVSDFGLVIITRKRVKQSLERVLTEPCPYCSGTGVIKSSSTICYEILSEVKKVSPELNGHRLLLRVNPDIARALKEEESAVVKDLRQTTGKDVTIRADEHLHHEQFDLMAV